MTPVTKVKGGEKDITNLKDLAKRFMAKERNFSDARSDGTASVGGMFEESSRLSETGDLGTGRRYPKSMFRTLY
jgi:hypothetical protein